MNQNNNVIRFESALAAVKRPGMDRLMEYIRKSDFYTAPASTKYHLSCSGGLLQHSLNVLDALRGLLPPSESDPLSRVFKIGSRKIIEYPDDSVIVVSLLHDICKTYFYKVGSRNVKNETTGKWEKVPTYLVDDKMPLGHGPKSAMIVKQYIPLSTPELYAIWHHMGPGGLSGPDYLTFEQAAGKYPLVWLLHSADMMSSLYLEKTNESLDATLDDFPKDFQEPEGGSFMPEDEGPIFDEAPPLPEEP